MPTITKYRFWCSHCQEWTLFNTNKYESCNVCGNPAGDVKYGDIPDEKIKEQRERWSKSQSIGTYLDVLFQKPKDPFLEMFNEDWETEYDIREHDAGQRKINERKQKEREERWRKKREEKERLQKEYEPFKNLRRNDQCACGSGLKYKKCCIEKFKTI